MPVGSDPDMRLLAQVEAELRSASAGAERAAEQRDTLFRATGTNTTDIAVLKAKLSIYVAMGSGVAGLVGAVIGSILGGK